MKVFTVTSGTVSLGADIVDWSPKGADWSTKAITVGEEGRGRKLGVLPVQCPPGVEKIENAVLGSTKSGKPKLIWIDQPDDSTDCIVVVRMEGGYRGSLNYTFVGGTTILVEGNVAEGIAGRMGSHDQYVVILPAGCMLGVKRFGRLYGAPADYIIENIEGNVCLRENVDIDDFQ